MSVVKTIWGLLFRLFPCPTPLGLRRIGKPDRHSPVLVTCNFDLTVERLRRALRGHSVWLLVAESKGVNVWCAAGGHELNTDSVVSAVKTSGIDELVDHRKLILPPLGAPGIRAADVEERTSWQVAWGPVRASDIPAYLEAGQKRTDAMKRATYDWVERLDTSLGSLFVFYLLGAIGFALFGRSLLLDYLGVGAGSWLLFMLACPWLPTSHGLTKALALSALIGAAWTAAELWAGPVDGRLRADAIIAMVTLLVWGSELGGMASTMPSDLDPFLGKLGIGAVGNVALAGTVRVDLLLGRRTLTHAPERCEGCSHCAEVCPQAVWELDADSHAHLIRLEDCTSCTACVVQCQSGAIKAKKQKPAARKEAAA